MFVLADDEAKNCKMAVRGEFWDMELFKVISEVHLA